MDFPAFLITYHIAAQKEEKLQKQTLRKAKIHLKIDDQERNVAKKVKE